MNEAKVVGRRSMPVLGVKDVAASIAFYRDKLGFFEGGQWGPEGGPPGFAIVGLDTITIAFDRDPDAKARAHGWIAYLYVDNVDAYHAELVARGVEILQAPHETFYGIREITVRDPDGHQLAFGQDLTPGPKGPGL